MFCIGVATVKSYEKTAGVSTLFDQYQCLVHRRCSLSIACCLLLCSSDTAVIEPPKGLQFCAAGFALDTCRDMCVLLCRSQSSGRSGGGLLGLCLLLNTVYNAQLTILLCFIAEHFLVI